MTALVYRGGKEGEMGICFYGHSFRECIGARTEYRRFSFIFRCKLVGVSVKAGDEFSSESAGL